MQKNFFLFLLLAPFISFSQDNNNGASKSNASGAIPTKVFYSQKLINSNTVEVLPKGVMEFRVSHDFGNIAGDNGGIKNFFGLDFATDVRIGFQTGLSNRLNLITARSSGSSSNGGLSELWELGLKYQILQQKDNDSKNPLSITIFANAVTSSMTSTYNPLTITTPTQQGQRDGLESNFQSFSDRISEVVQVMFARKFGKISFQLTPTYLHRSVVMQNNQHQDLDDKGMFALGGAARIPLSKKLSLIIDYFHAFRSKASIDSLGATPAVFSASRPMHLYDPIGIGFEILTAGHVFHLNFTNATQLLENRFIPRTETRWSKGEFRWGFTLSRNFVIFHDKKK